MRSYGQYCSVAKALDVVGDRWTLLVIRELLLQKGCRFTDLLHGLPGIATNLLTDRLRQLEEAGLVRREVVGPPVDRTLYHLTDEGRELEPVVIALGRFGARFMASPTGDESFRSHWLAFPVSEFLHDGDPSAPGQTIQLEAGDQSAVVEVDAGAVRSRPGTAGKADLTIRGDAPVVIGTLTGGLTLAQALLNGTPTT